MTTEQVPVNKQKDVSGVKTIKAFGICPAASGSAVSCCRTFLNYNDGNTWRINEPLSYLLQWSAEPHCSCELWLM